MSSKAQTPIKNLSRIGHRNVTLTPNGKPARRVESDSSMPAELASPEMDLQMLKITTLASQILPYDPLHSILGQPSISGIIQKAVTWSRRDGFSIGWRVRKNAPPAVLADWVPTLWPAEWGEHKYRPFRHRVNLDLPRECHVYLHDGQHSTLDPLHSVACNSQVSLCFLADQLSVGHNSVLMSCSTPANKQKCAEQRDGRRFHHIQGAGSGRPGQ